MRKPFVVTVVRASLFARAAALGVSLTSAAAWAAGRQAESREVLRKVLADVVSESPLGKSRVSLEVRSLEDGSVVFSYHPDELLNPASNVKLYTAAAALAKLGVEYRFETEFLTEGDPSKVKTLYVRGKGDPSITTERLYGMVSELLHHGLKEVGDLVVDDSFYDGERLAPGFDQENTDRAYMAPSGALSLNWNAVGVILKPGAPGEKVKVALEPASDYFTMENGASTGANRVRRFSVTSQSAGDHQKILVRGVVPFEREPLVIYKKIDNPPLYFANTLKALLELRGVKVRGKIRTGLVSSTARLVYTAQSDTFDIILKRLNKHSSNFVAEQLVKQMGAEVKGPPGSFAKGIEVVEDFLEQEVGIPRGSYVMKNGSGLNDTNRFSAAQTDRLLQYMYARLPLAPEYLSSVGIAGKDGTLKYRFEGSEAVGRLRAKTGTLENVTALSGYVQAVSGEHFSFSFFVNDYPGRAGLVLQGMDALGAAIAATGGSTGPKEAVAQVMTQPSVVGSADELKARMRTYLQLAAQADRHNLPFLRTAWRNERDPAVRAVVADALYQSMPDDYLAVRMLLDSFSSSEAVYGRLRSAAKEMGVDVPTVGSLIELSASGQAEALARMLELARVVAGDAQISVQLAQAFSEVARTAPDELILALKIAPLADQEAAVQLLARGLSAAADAQHPFWPSLRKAIGAVDSGLAAYAKSLESTLSVKIAEAKAPKANPAGPHPTVKSEVNPPKAADARPGG